MVPFLKRLVSLHACGVVALVGSLFAGGAVRADQTVISILANRAIVGAEPTGDCRWEPEQVQLALQPAFTSQLFEPYSAAAIASRLLAGELVIIPDQETASLLASWGADASLVRSAMQAGGRMLVFGDFGADDTQLLNYMLSGSSASPLIDAGTVGPFTRNPTAPSPFNTSPSSITWVDGTYAVRGWNPADVVYSGGVGGLDVVVATSQVGAGHLGFIAYDFFCPEFDPIDAAAWAEVARAMVQHLMHVPTANSVVCWGSNANGQSTVPADLGPCTMVAGGDLHSIAIRTDGLVRCWGWNGVGQCNVPSDLGACTAIAGGSMHTVALRVDGAVRCWGGNSAGQCNVPPTLGAATAVAGGAFHTVALRVDGAVRCWGSNAFGESQVPADLGACIAIASGGAEATLALRADRSVRGWGNSEWGYGAVPADLGPCTAIAAGFTYAVALQADGTLRQWGNGSVTVPGPFAEVAGGADFCIARRLDGSVWVNGTTPPADLGSCIAVGAGGGHYLAILGPAPDFALSLSSSAASLSAGDTFTVLASSTAPVALLSGAQLAVHFDAARLRLDSVVPNATSPLDMELAEQINNTAGTLCYALGLSNPAIPLASAADLCELTFTVLPGADLCDAANLVTFGDVGAFTTRFTRFDNSSLVVPALTDLPPINLDSTPPVLSGVPVADIFVGTDAGSTYGALVSLPPVTATDACEGAVSVTVTGAIASGLYPIGTTTVTWSASDSVGNTATVSRNIVVGDYQLLDARISLNGVLAANAPRSIRVTAGASVGVHPVTVLAGTGGVGTIAGIQVPVASSYPCVSAKDAVHSLTRTAATSIVGARYEATFALVQGDSNDDDMIEIVDYATFVIDRGIGKAPDARSNFNADIEVNNADFAHIAMSFFTVGDSCTGALAGARPRERISVKELRRMGLGELAAADLNHDGWFDMRDMQIAVQGNAGSNGGAAAQPSAAEGSGVRW